MPAADGVVGLEKILRFHCGGSEKTAKKMSDQRRRAAQRAKAHRAVSGGRWRALV